MLMLNGLYGLGNKEKVMVKYNDTWVAFSDWCGRHVRVNYCKFMSITLYTSDNCLNNELMEEMIWRNVLIVLINRFVA